jgi:hypothetical protein
LPPVIQNPPTPFLNLDCAKDVPPPVNLTAIDNCDGEITTSPSTLVIPGSCPNDFVMVRNWTFVDTCGNLSSVSQTINVSDTLPPVIQNPPTPFLNLDCAEDYPQPAPLTAIDNCDGEIIVHPNSTFIIGSCTNDFVEERTWTFIDTCGNTSSVTQTITVEDTKPPTFDNCPPDITVECEAGIPSLPNLAASDNCAQSVNVVFDGEVRRESSCSVDGTYTLTRRWTATDICENTSSCTQVITVDTKVDVNDCFSVQLLRIDTDGTNTTYTWKVNSDGDCPNSLGFIVFEMPCGMIAVAPEKRNYQGVSGINYIVENPSTDAQVNEDGTLSCRKFYGLKFNTKGKGIKDGQMEQFVYTLPGDYTDPASDLFGFNPRVQIKAGPGQGDISPPVSVEDCICDPSEGSFELPEILPQSIPPAQEVPGETQIRAYPIPSSSDVTIEFTLPENGNAILDIYSLSGQKMGRIFEQEVEAGLTYYAKIEGSSLPKGTYIYRLTTGTSSFQGKVLLFE